MKRDSWIRLLLTLFVVSIVVNAILGIWALLIGDFGETQGKVLATSFLVSAAMLSVLVNVPAFRRGVLWSAPAVGAATGVAGFGLLTVLLWADTADERWFKLAGSALVVAAGATLASSLALLTLPASFRWLHRVANVLIGLLAATILYLIWFDPGSDWYGRIVGVESVLVAAVTLLIPVLARFAPTRRPATDDDRDRPGPPAVRFCPSCGTPLGSGSSGVGEEVVCDGCGVDFAVTLGLTRSRDQPGPA